jgi:hypothetical protein
MVHQDSNIMNHKKTFNNHQGAATGFRGVIGQLRGVAEGLLATRWGGAEQRTHVGEHQSSIQHDNVQERSSSGLVELMTTHDDGGSLYGSWEAQSNRRRSRKDSSHGSMPPLRQRLLREPDEAEAPFGGPQRQHDEKDRSVVEILSQAMSARTTTRQQLQGNRHHDGAFVGERSTNETPAPPIRENLRRQINQRQDDHDSHRKRHYGAKHSKAASVFSRDAIAMMEQTHQNDLSRPIPSRLRSGDTRVKNSNADEGMLDIAPLVALACDRIATMSSAQHHAAAARRRIQATPDQHEDVTAEDHSLSCCARTTTEKLGLLETTSSHLPHQPPTSASLGSFDAPRNALLKPTSLPSKRLLVHSEDDDTHQQARSGDASASDVASIQSVIEEVSKSISYSGSGRMVVVAALVYLGRLSAMCDCDRYRVSKTNHMRTATVCLLAATKMYIEADQSPRRINVAFANASRMSLSELSRLEVTLLYLLDFSLIVDEPEARRWCQWLHDVALRKGMEAPLHSFFQTCPHDAASSPFTPCASMTHTPPTTSLDIEGTISPMLYAGTSLPSAIAHSRSMSGQIGQPSPLPSWAPLPPSVPWGSQNDYPPPMALGAAAVPMTMASPLALQPLSHPDGLSPAPRPADNVQSCRLFSCIFQTHLDGTCSPPTSSDDEEAPPSPPHEDRSPMRSFLSHGTELHTPPSPPQREHTSDVLRDFSRLVRHASATPQVDGCESRHGLGRQHRTALSPPSDLGPRRRRTLSSPEDESEHRGGGAARFLRRGNFGDPSIPPAPDDDDRWKALTQRRQCLSPIEFECQ